MGVERYRWASECEVFGVTVVTGVTARQALEAVAGPDPVELQTVDDQADWEGPQVAIADVDGCAVLYDDATVGLDPRVIDRLSCLGRTVAVAYGMTVSVVAVAEQGVVSRAFDPMLRGPWSDEWLDDGDPEEDRTGDPLPEEDRVEWSEDGRSGSMRLLELLTGIQARDPWADDTLVRWYGYPEPPPAPDPELPPLESALMAASPSVRELVMRQGLESAASSVGLAEHQGIAQALRDGQVLLALSAPPGVAVPTAPDAMPLNEGDTPERAAQERLARERLHSWEIPLGQRLIPVLYPRRRPDGSWEPTSGPGAPPRYDASAVEMSELRLAMASGHYLSAAGIRDYWALVHDCTSFVGQISMATGEQFPRVQALMMALLT